MKELAPTLKNISAERIQVELVKTLVSPNPTLLLDAYELGITKQFLPELDRMMETHNVGEHTLCAIEKIRNDKVLRLTMLLHELEDECIAKSVLKRMKFDNDTLNKVTKLVLYHDYCMPAIDKDVRHAINKIGEELFPYYLEVRRADILAQSNHKIDEEISHLDKIEEIYKEILEKGQCVSLKTLAVSGKDLIQAGMKPGKEIGDKLGEFLELVLDNPDLNTKKELLSRL